MYKELNRLMVESGIWIGNRRETHGFLLSPEPYVISKGHKAQLESIALALNICLRGLSRIFAIAADPILGSPRWWRNLGNLMKIQVPDYFNSVMGMHPDAIPFLSKIDLVEDTEGKLWIVEIDAGNPRALGFSHFFTSLIPNPRVSGQPFPGVLNPMLQVVRNQDGKLTCLLSERERWYLPWVEVLIQALKNQGLEEMEVVLERDFVFENKTLLLHMPLVMNKSLVRNLFERYKSGGLKFLMPPKPFLGSKGLLAILWNLHEDPILEGVLRSQIPEEHLKLLREHIPKTGFLYPGQGPPVLGPVVLKSLVSSGMHGVYFSDDEKYAHAYGEHERKKGSAPTAVLQTLVNVKKVKFNHFDETGHIIQDERYVRFAAHVGDGKVADVSITARTDRAVHGAKDAILTGCVVS